MKILVLAIAFLVVVCNASEKADKCTYDAATLKLVDRDGALNVYHYQDKDQDYLKKVYVIYENEDLLSYKYEYCEIYEYSSTFFIKRSKANEDVGEIISVFEKLYDLSPLKGERKEDAFVELREAIDKGIKEKMPISLNAGFSTKDNKSIDYYFAYEPLVKGHQVEDVFSLRISIGLQDE